MKKIILIITLITASAAVKETLSSSSFNRRWGANSIITNMPLFYKPYQYEQYDYKNDSEYRKPRRSVRKKAHQHSATCGCNTTAPARHTTTREPAKSAKTTVIVGKSNTPKPEAATKLSRRETRAQANAQYASMRQKQAELETEQAQLQHEVAELKINNAESDMAKV